MHFDILESIMLCNHTVYQSMGGSGAVFVDVT